MELSREPGFGARFGASFRDFEAFRGLNFTHRHAGARRGTSRDSAPALMVGMDGTNDSPTGFRPQMELWTEEQVSAFTGIAVGTLRNWRSNKTKSGIPYVKLAGNNVRYLADDVYDWVRSRRVVTA